MRIVHIGLGDALTCLLCRAASVWSCRLRLAWPGTDIGRTMRSTLSRVDLALAFAVGLTASGVPAFADIKSSIQAVRASDFRAASVVAADTWPELDKSAPEIAVVAREFAWVSMLAGQPAAAEVYSRFLVDQGAALPRPDPTPCCLPRAVRVERAQQDIGGGGAVSAVGRAPAARGFDRARPYFGARRTASFHQSLGRGRLCDRRQGGRSRAERHDSDRARSTMSSGSGCGAGASRQAS